MRFKKLTCGFPLLLGCLFESGCAEFIASEGASRDYDQRVRDARGSGMNDRDAQRRAFEGQYFGDPH